MEFRVLGSIEVLEDGRRLAVSSGRQRSLLAFLLIHANRVVSADRIIDELWGDDPPDSGAKAVAFHVSRLRDALEPERVHGRPNGLIVTEPAGYILKVDPAAIDAVRFERSVSEGHGLLTDDPGAARALLAEGLGLWRGEAYAEVADEPFARAEIRRLDELRLQGLEDRLDADLALGRHEDVVGELEALVAEQPLRERLRGQLMVALYRLGRQSDALRVYGDGRHLLSAELGIDPGPELQQLEGWILRHDRRLEAPAHRRAARNPYKGLRAFGEEDSADFFGREALTERLVDRLGQVARAGRFLAVVGASGSGKSSVVRAGLVPALRAGALAGSDHWRVAEMRPGARPFRELAAALRAVAEAALDPTEALERDGDVGRAVDAVSPDGAPVLIVIDQFEELFSLVPDEAERSRFLAAVLAALSAPDGRLLVVVTLRADFFAAPLLVAGWGELVRSGTEVVAPLDRGGLERAILRPAEAVGVTLEPGLAQEVIADVARQPGELPLMQYALTELFDRSDGRQLTRGAYAEIGGVLGVLDRQAEDAYSTLDAEGREIARQAFLRLVMPGEAGESIARRVPRSELEALSDDRPRIDRAIDEFGRRRLLAFDRDAVTGEPTIQVAHEALLDRWSRLAGWIEEARDDLWTRRRLADAAAEWIREGRDPGFLLTGSRLDLFATWAASTDLRLDQPERDLLEASLEARRRSDEEEAVRAAHERSLERRATTRLRALVAVLGVAVIAAVAVSAALYRGGETAREQSAVATARELAAASIGSLGSDPQLSLLLAWQAGAATSRYGYVVEQAMDALHLALQASHVAYPAGDPPVAVRAGPGGAIGVPLLPPDRLMAMASDAASRPLTDLECRTYLHVDVCPPRPGPTGAVPDVYTAQGVVPVDLLATGSLAGTRVDLVSELPVGMDGFAAAFKERTGVDVAVATGPTGDLESRLASGDLPDVAIVSRPVKVAELGRAGRLVDLSGMVDVARLRSTAGDYLVQLGTVGWIDDWPASSGSLYGAPMAMEASGLVWYPPAAFERAGYTAPRTTAELVALVDGMAAAGRTPWCLGLGAGSGAGSAATGPGAVAAGIVEDSILDAGGPDAYDRWVRVGSFGAGSVRAAFESLGRLVFPAGSVHGGLASARLMSPGLAGWPMFLDPPQCWLEPGGGSARLSWPTGASARVTAFPFPAADPRFADAIRGRLFTVVVVHDRPEVRQLVATLLGGADETPLSAMLAPAGIVSLGSASSPRQSSAAASPDEVMLWRAVRAGTFRVSFSDLVPSRVAAAFRAGVMQYLSVGPLGLSRVLSDIDASWRAAP